MTIQTKPTTLAILAAVVCLSVIGLLTYWRYLQVDTVAELLARLPTENATVLYIDLHALRTSGLLDLLAGTGAEEEADYRQFVRETGFNYRSDLDCALIAFHERERFLLLRGRFRWGQIEDYVKEKNGTCINSFCQVRGSSPDRIISFYPLTYRYMAMASSPDRSAALAMQENVEPVDPENVPNEPFWVSMSGAELTRAKWLPDGTRSFATALSRTERVVLAVGPKGDGFEARLRADCGSPQEAIKLATEFERVTELLRSLIRLEDKTPSDRDLSGVLTNGTFETVGSRLIGRWPISHQFLSALSEN